jgi:hypothetical protein
MLCIENKDLVLVSSDNTVDTGNPRMFKLKWTMAVAIISFTAQSVAMLVSYSAGAFINFQAGDQLSSLWFLMESLCASFAMQNELM